MLRQMVDTVGQVGQPGEKIQNVIAVAMLSEGWDAKTLPTSWACAPFPASFSASRWWVGACAGRLTK